MLSVQECEQLISLKVINNSGAIQFNYLWDLNERLKLKAGHGKYYQTRIDTEPQIIEQAQSSLDIDFRQKALAASSELFPQSWR